MIGNRSIMVCRLTTRLGYGLGPLATQSARTSVRYSLLAAVAALLVDNYLY